MSYPSGRGNKFLRSSIIDCLFSILAFLAIYDKFIVILSNFIIFVFVKIVNDLGKC